MLRPSLAHPLRVVLGGAAAPMHPREIDRLASMVGLRLDDVEGEPLFDEIARQAATFFGTPLAAVTLVREHEETFIGNVGMPGGGALREDSICAHTILGPGPFVVRDLREDPRFCDLPLVTGAPHARFYAGAPVFDAKGLPMGTVCVLGPEPRDATSVPLQALGRLATMAGVLLEARRFVADLLGPGAHPVALHKALARMDGVLDPLFARAEGLRAAA